MSLRRRMFCFILGKKLSVALLSCRVSMCLKAADRSPSGCAVSIQWCMDTPSAPHPHLYLLL